MQSGLHILYEDNHLLAVAKPAGLATMGVKPDRPSLIADAKRYIKRRYNKPGNVYLAVASRLDVPVSGVIVFARTSKAAARLNEQFRGRSVRKEYWAVVEGTVAPRDGKLEDWLVSDPRHRRVHVSRGPTPEAKEARLAYHTLERLPRWTQLEIDLETGRKHQIRIQLSHAGWPILGDRKYGGRESFGTGIALHARRLTIEHPTQRVPLELVAPLPASWRRLGIEETTG